MIGNISNNKIKENKYKILRMSLLLGNGDDREETINNFEDAAREIDSMNDEIYLKDLDSKFYDTLTLEEEEKKLAVLVDYIGGRVEQRISLLSDFSNITGFELINLPLIKYQDKLDDYKNRLSYIREYLDNTKKINSLKTEISDLENKLNDSYVKKAKSEEKNMKDEEDLLNRFKHIIKDIPEFEGVNLDNVDSKLNDIIGLAQDSKKSLDIFDKSFATLNQVGISGEEREEYLSYVNGAKAAYYNNKEIEYLFKIYILLNNFESEYSKILFKRDSLNDIICERINLRKELNISENDVLSGIYDLLDKQYDNIKDQSDNIDSIESYINEVSVRKDEVSILEQDNQKVEILSLLKEFCIIDTYDGVDENKVSVDVNNVGESSEEKDKLEVDNSYDTVVNFDNSREDIDISKEDVNSNNEDVNISEEDINNSNEDISIEIEDVKDNQVASVNEALKINIEEAILKSNNVMKRVGEMLGVKLNDTKVVSVTSDSDNSSNDSNVINDNSDTNVRDDDKKEDNGSNEKEENNDVVSDFDADNIFTNTIFDADPENNSEDLNDSNVVSNENPLFSNSLENSTIDDVMAKNNSNLDSNDFWYSNEDSTIDLNSLPDLSVSNDNFFGNNELPDLGFPDLNNDFFNSKEENNGN